MDEVKNKESRVGDGHLRQCSVLAENRDTCVEWCGIVTHLQHQTEANLKSD